MTSADVLHGQNTPSSLRVHVITSLSALQRLRPQWLDLSMRSPGEIGFTAPGAVLAWFRHVSRYSSIHVVTVWRDDDLVGLAPFSVIRLGPFRLFATAGAGYGFYGGPLLGSEPEHVAAVLHNHVSAVTRGGRGAVYFRRLPTADPLLHALEHSGALTCTPMGSAETNSVVDFSTMADPEQYFARVSRKHAVPRRIRRLTEQVGTLEIVAEDPDTVGALDSMRDMIVRRFGEDLRMFRGKHNRAVTDELVRGLIADAHARVASIKADGRRIAVTVEMSVGTRMFWYAVAYEPDFHNFSIGHIELYNSLLRAHTSSVKAVDLGSSGFEYKKRWANSEARFQTVTVTAPGVMGAAANHLRRAAITTHRRLVQARDLGLPII